jgi:hypothetical protein
MAVAPLAGLSGFALGQNQPAQAPALPLSDNFPSHPPEVAREMVLVSHFNLKRVQELVTARPALARAAWDWGFGDWESALGAASHMGNRAIAEYLIANGARPSIFSAAMLGQLEVVKAFLAANPGVARTRGPHSISLLAHARVGGDKARAILEFLQSLKEADMEAPATLTAEEAAALVGTYSFGPNVNQQVEVDADTKIYTNSKMYSYAPQLNWTRKGTMPRPLFHLGGHEFWPAGAASVRIRFVEESGAMTMSAHDPDVVLTARKSSRG